MAKKKGTKRGRQAEAAAAQDVYEAEDEQPAEEKPNKARKRYDVSAPCMPKCTLPTHVRLPCCSSLIHTSCYAPHSSSICRKDEEGS